jgi:nitrite reductase (NADH) small subunit
MSEPVANPTQSNANEPQWIRLIPVSRCQPGAGTFVEHGRRELGIFLLGSEQVFVIDNACPHAGGNLSGGDVVERVVTCPWHQWQFDLGTGVCIDSAAARVQKYPARCHNGWVEIQLPMTP